MDYELLNDTRKQSRLQHAKMAEFHSGRPRQIHHHSPSVASQSFLEKQFLLPVETGILVEAPGSLQHMMLEV